MSNKNIREQIVDIRRIFVGELEFSAWLEEHIDVLSDCINLPLQVEGREVQAGNGRADLVCRDNRGKRVIIENQLKKADYDHYGRLIMYMGNLKAIGAIWIAPEFHPAIFEAIRHLNNQTKKGYFYYLVQVEAIRTGRAEPVPVFTLHYPPIIVDPAAETKITSINLSSKTGCSPAVWCIHPHHDEKIYDLLLGNDIICLGFGDWRDLGKLSPEPKVFKAAWAKHCPDMPDARLKTCYTATYNFVYGAIVGDMVIYASKWLEGEIYVGKITGEYEYKRWQSTGRKGRRSVKWIASLPCEKFTPEALKGIRGNRAFFQVRSEQFLDELDQILKRKRK